MKFKWWEGLILGLLLALYGYGHIMNVPPHGPNVHKYRPITESSYRYTLMYPDHQLHLEPDSASFAEVTVFWKEGKLLTFTQSYFARVPIKVVTLANAAERSLWNEHHPAGQST